MNVHCGGHILVLYTKFAKNYKYSYCGGLGDGSSVGGTIFIILWTIGKPQLEPLKLWGGEREEEIERGGSERKWRVKNGGFYG